MPDEDTTSTHKENEPNTSNNVASQLDIQHLQQKIIQLERELEAARKEVYKLKQVEVSYTHESDDPSAQFQAREFWNQPLRSRKYDFFISYRVSQHRKLALELYFRLLREKVIDYCICGNVSCDCCCLDGTCPNIRKERNVTVFLDQECLLSGEAWIEGFQTGLRESRCVLMLISQGTLDNMVNADRQVDNVLCEWEMSILGAKFEQCRPVPIVVLDSRAFTWGMLSNDINRGRFPSVRYVPDGTTHGCMLSAKTTLTELGSLQGLTLDPDHVAWMIPDAMQALDNFRKQLSTGYSRSLQLFKNRFEGRKGFESLWDSKHVVLNSRIAVGSDLVPIARALNFNTSWMSILTSSLTIDDQLLNELCVQLIANSRITTLNLNNANIGSSVSHVAKLVRANTALKILALDGSALGDQGVDVLVKGLMENNSINDLSIRGNNVTSIGTESLASLLRTSKILKSLNLSENKIRSKGLEKLLTALIHTKSLTSLDVSSNDIDVVPASNSQNETLTELIINENKLDFVSFCNIFAWTKRLKVVKINYNSIEHIDWNTIRRFGGLLTKLDFEGNPLDTDSVRYFVTAEFPGLKVVFPPHIYVD